MKNEVIEVLTKAHGRKVIEYWRSQGIDTILMEGSNAKSHNAKNRYYGVINNTFGGFSIEVVKDTNTEIIELPEEKPFPRVMLVSYDGEAWYKRVVFMKKCDMFLSWDNAETIESAEWTYRVAAWRYAKDLPEKVELTKAEIAERLGISVDQLVIKDN